jgi:hypothetical protein
VRDPVSVRRDCASFSSHPPKQVAEELVVKPGVWVYDDLRERLKRHNHEYFSTSLPSDGRTVHNKALHSSREVVGHDKYSVSLSARRMMSVSVIYGRTLQAGERMAGKLEDEERVEKFFHANHAVIMNEICCILQVFRQGIDVKRLTKDVVICVAEDETSVDIM